MARLHDKLLDSLQMLPADQGVHLLTRHSVREQASNGFADYRLALTEEGVQMARDWGQLLGRPLECVTSSPVGRCVDTAKAMMEGACEAGWLAAPLPIEQSTVLVEPGCYVEDINAAVPHFMRLGALRFINHHLANGIEGLLSPLAGRDKLLGFLRARQPPPSKLALHVTHDTIIMAFVAELMGWSEVSSAHWPWMMEGVWLWFAGDELHWIWRGEHHLMQLDSGQER